MNLACPTVIAGETARYATRLRAPRKTEPVPLKVKWFAANDDDALWLYEWRPLRVVLTDLVRDALISAIKQETRVRLELVCGPILEADRRRRARAR